MHRAYPVACRYYVLSVSVTQTESQNDDMYTLELRSAAVDCSMGHTALKLYHQSDDFRF